jgi:hypothetical protein
LEDGGIGSTPGGLSVAYLRIVLAIVERLSELWVRLIAARRNGVVKASVAANHNPKPQRLFAVVRSGGSVAWFYGACRRTNAVRY